MKRKNKKSLIIILLLFISLGYAYLNSNLQINGTTGIAGNTWDIHFENVVPSSNNTVTPTIAPVANPIDKVTELTYSVRFNKPGDIYEFNVDVVNAGTIDAMIESFTSKIKIGDGEEQDITPATLPRYLNYYVKYSDGVVIRNNHLLNASTRETITVHVEYKTNISNRDLEDSSGKSILFDIDIEYEQATEDGIEKPTYLNCTYEGDLVNNAEYINGQYSYYYNSETEGWRASLIDRNATDPVTTPLCSKINGKPINDMYGMFANSKTTSIDTSSFDTSHVTNMASMFLSCQFEEIDLSSFDTRNVTNMSAMFNGCSELTELDLSNFDTSKVTNMGGFIASAPKLEKLNLSNWDFSKYNGHFKGVVGSSNYIKHLDLSRAIFGNDMGGFFSDFSNLETIIFDNVNTSRVTNMSALFSGDSRIAELDLSSFDTSNVTNMDNIFENMSSLEDLNISGWNISKISNSFHDIIYHYTIKRLDVSNVIFGRDMSVAFSYSYLTNLEYLNLSGVDTSRTVDMHNAFHEFKLPSIDLSDFDTQNVTNMRSMFERSKIERLDLSNWDTSSLTNMGYFCSACYELKYLNLNGWGNDNLSFIGDMTYGDSKLEEIHMRNFNFGTIWTIGSTQGPFYDKTSLKVVDLYGAKMNNISQMIRAFMSCKELEELDMSNIIAPTPITASYVAFDGATKLTSLDISGFDFSQLESAGSMFGRVPATTVYVKDQASLDKLNLLSDKPDTMTFVIKP